MNEYLAVKENLNKTTFDALGYLKDRYPNEKVVHFSPDMYDAFKSHPTVQPIYSKTKETKEILSLLPDGLVDIPEGDCFLYSGTWFCRNAQFPDVKFID